MADEPKNPNDFRPKRKPEKGKAKTPKVYTFLKPELEVQIDEQEVERKKEKVLVCRCDKVCTCDTVAQDKKGCRCDTVAKCTCETVSACSCNTVVVCSCDKVKTCRCNPQCSCNSHSPGGGGTRVCRCVPVRAH